MALGTASLTPLSMARAYAVFANGGYLVRPEFIRRITDINGAVVYRTRPAVFCDDCDEALAEQAALAQQESSDEPAFKPLSIVSDDAAVESVDEAGPENGVGTAARTETALAPRVVSAQNAWLVRSMMLDVVRRGTGRRAMELGRRDLAGKTGTTNDQRDAWFSGYNDHLVTTVWVGFDDHEPLGREEQGGRAALPVWIEFMAEALDGVEESPSPMPDGLAQARIDPETGLLAPLDSEGSIMEIFEAGKMPPMQERADGDAQDAPLEEDPYEIY